MAWGDHYENEPASERERKKMGEKRGGESGRGNDGGNVGLSVRVRGVGG